MSNSAMPWTIAHQAPPSMGFSRQEYWSGVPFPSPTLAFNQFFLFFFLTHPYRSHEWKKHGTCAAQLDALSPLKVLGRGYAMATREDRVVRSVTQLEVGDTVTVSLSDGTAQCRVEGLQRRKQRGKKTDI